MDEIMSTTQGMISRGAESELGDFKLYRYTPSLLAAAISAGVFAILTNLHAWRMMRARTWYFVAFTIGGVFQVLGYCGRIWSHYDDMAIGGFVIQAILILVAPALYAASIYMILGRLIRALHAQHLSLVPVEWLSKIFVAGDVISFTMQAGGGGVQSAGSLELYEIGEKLIIAGLWVQIIIFGLFMVTAVIFHYRLSRSLTSRAASGEITWERYLYVLYGASTLILVRSAFRVVEYLQGNGGYLISHEIFLYLFDAALMAAVMAVFLVWYVEALAPDVSYKQQNDQDLSEHPLRDFS
ncbi:Protein RTA1 [Ilyonectria robusta]